LTGTVIHLENLVADYIQCTGQIVPIAVHEIGRENTLFC
jgi:hypothetical protein